MESVTQRFATPRVAAGALFVSASGKVLLVRKTYGNRWDIPGGYVDGGESPAQACSRELAEEIGLQRQPRRVLAVDWAPTEHDGDKLLWVFDCGDLADDEHRIQLDSNELDSWDWVPVHELDDYLIPRLARRLKQAHAAHEKGCMVYLEHGEPTME
ncbi:NUDIX hydrolase [Haloactinomyces albus]|uniref:8-oxo-dGTP pyrophosphatase MutT (NUDIX family) n=1 Tax=Haloactinomyces albus TaxID=1352928 RepID=A0AAE3ZB24_9ACTN|nr:NUDIX hydrolase [Haloactinomyces albus]MDR7301626.1 8-oxo-dGTP pyrophosphatase MutT (NUDIX family) [Haloactinomyces albus]MDR7304672.1 8-oxo-dGTP pyrophosphatase MutT (NUDIX family) [Haloactinomyces albus]MDR7304682.1 8-oxo-dGTP pyrophosphatase MutT (NUDIX family) [Haloactinomyces albus]MDR7304696.1 8-oxo-dGTP pyrophosphatase MutT (NUDIX family) [Haloactinomyces albus]MDR7304706.1 8-oxo-dGTP pyrophosphatase MutT (NUDIX family) [Haloactinomyces albus]